ncbi:MAG: SpoIIE family protein phosphatase [Magnetococcales bacterium]|nr:SpoIIE family protein phosphatase [Magnetococcales bacterium]
MSIEKFHKNRNKDRRASKKTPIFPLTRANGVTIDQEERRLSNRRNRNLNQHLDLFRHVKEKQILRTLKNCPILTFSERTVLLRKGEVNNKLYLVLSGEVQILLGDADSATNFLVPTGQCVGEMSIIDHQPTSAHVVAAPGCRLLEIDEDSFWNNLMTLPLIARNLLQLQTERARANNDAILEKMQWELRFKMVEKDLEIASQIQMSMLPRNLSPLPNHPELDIFARMTPAREIGGDLYDFFPLGPDRFFFMLGDVSGKGIPAALFMVRTMTLFRSSVGSGMDPAAVLFEVNNRLRENNDRFLFVTLICGIFDLSTQTIIFSNAGHNQPLLLGKEGACDFLSLPEGNVAGVITDSTYTNSQIKLSEGEQFFLFTDGVTEATNDKVEMFSEQRLHDSIAKKVGSSSKELVEEIFKEVFEFTGEAPMADDITILALGLTS